MGYSVPEHFAALNRLGPTSITAARFAPVAALLGVGASAEVDEPRCRSDSLARHVACVLPLPSIAAAPMFHVSLILEVLRARPRAGVLGRGAGAGRAVDAGAVAVLRGAARRVPLVLAVGHEFLLGTPSRAAARLLARRDRVPRWPACSASICCRSSAWSSTYWAVFALGRGIVGAAHAAMAVLLMVGIACSRCRRWNSGRPCWRCRSGR